MHVFELTPPAGYERVARATCSRTGLNAIIAVHNTHRGPALGGTRCLPYASDDDMLTDVIRLARGMTYKAAIAGLHLGGGKAVMARDKDGSPPSAERMHVLGRFVEEFGGTYVTTEDMGMTPALLEEAAKATEHVVGLNGRPWSSGDPGPYTARGVFAAIKAAAAHAFPHDLSHLKVVVLGLGSVGGRLSRYLAEAGAQLVLSDIDEDRVATLAKELGAQTVPIDHAHAVDADIFSPCARGAILNDTTIPELKAKVVCGAANNQLTEDRHGDLVHERGVLYVPDYVANGGGVIALALEIEKSLDSIENRMARMDDIGNTVTEICTVSAKNNAATWRVADMLAEQRFQPERTSS